MLFSAENNRIEYLSIGAHGVLFSSPPILSVSPRFHLCLSISSLRSGFGLLITATQQAMMF